MAETIIDGEVRPSPGQDAPLDDPSPADPIDARSRLEAALERQTALREAAERALARARDEHEDGYERLLVRCRALESEKARWAEAGLDSLDDLARIRAEHRDALARRLTEAEDAASERVGGLERRLADAEREAARSDRLLADERDRAEVERHRVAAERLAAEEREADLSRTLLAAEERYRVDAFRLSSVVALRTEEAEAALAEAASERAGRDAAQRQLAAMTASSSWKLARPLRVAVRLLRRALRRAAG